MGKITLQKQGTIHVNIEIINSKSYLILRYPCYVMFNETDFVVKDFVVTSHNEALIEVRLDVGRLDYMKL